MTDFHAVSPSTEDYLEAIWKLISEKGAARVRDIAAALSVHKSTVSATLKGLSEKGLVKYSRYEITTLTALGEEIAQDVHRRHEVIGRFLTEILGISDDAAQSNACRMEHIVDAEVLERISLLVDFAEGSLAKGENWAQQFQHYSKSKLRSKRSRKFRAASSGDTSSGSSGSSGGSSGDTIRELGVPLGVPGTQYLNRVLKRQKPDPTPQPRKPRTGKAAN